MEKIFSKNYYRSLVKEKKVKQIFFLYTSMVLGLVIGILISVVNTRYLGPQLYGDFKFILSIYTLSATFFTIGVFYSAARLIIQKNHAGIKKRIIGLAILIGVIISIIYSAFIFGFSFFENRLFDNNLGYLIRLLAPFAFAFPLDQLSQNLLQGDNKIYDLAIYRLAQKIAYLALAYVYHILWGLTLNSALFIYFLSFMLTIIYAFIRLKPEYNLSKEIFSILKIENKNYGLQVYYGALFSLASAQVGAIVVGYFIDTVNVGFYSLAITATLPLTLIPSTIGTTFFKDFSSMQRIPPRVFLYTILISIGTLLLFIAFIKEIVLILYTDDFISVTPLAIIISIGSVFHGLGDFFNRFLSAHGKGKELRNSSIWIGVANILGFLILIKLVGVQGAAITKILSGLTYLGIMIYYYKKFRTNK
ncbi:MAG: hypothetical protein A2X13_09580 [Bacteroidetes bacterium GWC2_33_15]|nr:MAG: hypothetical protein A2X10_10795 [Bacteroidetes bacterium GWA2_33_15]OFX48952.1 MAG: hypothetical protein A2X13_09580 [Bacteroidetes bacterium GWC2_33_15]OFX64784.1 MAG: hypothetical protein A2X15_05635 [Bacteroidetes bacterium GWB2_32_14]OFX68486.1 MAG: hypothetical protein A2X14_15190 [Bacteroidetes bacterium GWD2_33_33]HAN19212.1 hypothetical protein [Bacteroidales bacterium]